jgi:hypothetical protein
VQTENQQDRLTRTSNPRLAAQWQLARLTPLQRVLRERGINLPMDDLAEPIIVRKGNRADHEQDQGQG